MKYAGICLVVAFTMLVACVKEEIPRFDQSVIGIMEHRPEFQKNVLVGLDSVCYHAPEFDDTALFPAGSFWSVYCRVEKDDPAAGYKDVVLNEVPIPFLEASFRTSADTIQVQDNECAIRNMRVLCSPGNLYVISEHTDSIGQQNRLELFYSEKDTLARFNDCNVYSLYMRSYQSTAATDTLLELRKAYTAFDVASFLQSRKEEEKAAGNRYFYIRVKYLIRVTTGTVNTATPYIPSDREYVLVTVD